MTSADPNPPPNPRPLRLAPVLSRSQRLLALVLTAIAYWLVCFAPYDWVAPASYTLNDARWVPTSVNQPVALDFSGMGIAELAVAQGLPRQLAPQSLRLLLRLQCREEEQFGPARIVSLSADTLARNLMLGQDGRALVVRLLRPASNNNGVPEFRVEDFFRGCEERDIDLHIADGALSLRSGNQRMLDIAAPQASLERWVEAYPFIVGNEGSWDRGWSGQLSALRFVVDGNVIVRGVEDLVLPHGAWLLSRRAKGAHRFTLVPFSGDVPSQVVDNILNVLGFLPFGLLLVVGWGSRLNWLYAGVLAALLSSSIELGQIGFAGRFPSATDLATNTIGGIVGFVIGMRWLRRKRQLETVEAQTSD